MQPYEHTHIMHQLTHTVQTHLHTLTGSQSPKRVVDLCCDQGKAVEVQYLFLTTRRALKRGPTYAGLQLFLSGHLSPFSPQWYILYMQSINKPMQHLLWVYKHLDYTYIALHHSSVYIICTSFHFWLSAKRKKKNTLSLTIMTGFTSHTVNSLTSENHVWEVGGAQRLD